jgi:chromosome partitioning protein
MLGDADRQASAREWLERRPPTAAAIVPWEVDGSIVRPPPGVTHVVLDTPAGISDKRLARVLKLADSVVVPVQPSPFDMSATARFIERLRAEPKLARRSADRIAVVGMRVDARTRSADELDRFLGGLGLPAVGRLRDTQDYVRLAVRGLTLFDLPSTASPGIARAGSRSCAGWRGRGAAGERAHRGAGGAVAGDARVGARGGRVGRAPARAPLDGAADRVRARPRRDGDRMAPRRHRLLRDGRPVAAGAARGGGRRRPVGPRASSAAACSTAWTCASCRMRGRCPNRAPPATSRCRRAPSFWACWARNRRRCASTRGSCRGPRSWCARCASSGCGSTARCVPGSRSASPSRTSRRPPPRPATRRRGTLGGQYNGFCRQGDFEVIRASGLVGGGARVAAEAIELLQAPECPSGVRDCCWRPTR